MALNLREKTLACYGIECWLRKQNIGCSVKFTSQITAEFLKYKKLPYVKYNKNYKGLFTANIQNAELIQENWQEFKQFVLKKYKKIND